MAYSEVQLAAPSEKFKKIHYDEDQQIMETTYHNKKYPDLRGAVYLTRNVTPTEIARLVAASEDPEGSAGSLYHEIFELHKDLFPCEKLLDAEVPK